MAPKPIIILMKNSDMQFIPLSHSINRGKPINQLERTEMLEP